jgi:antitoxin component of RelBE/YafQ-DinJ toxin-antitoxin module
MIAKRNMIVMIRMLPDEKMALTELANQLGVSVSDVIRLALHELFHQKHISYPMIQAAAQPQLTPERREAPQTSPDD